MPRRMTGPWRAARRLLCGGVVLAAVALGTAACQLSPYAAIVNGQVITPAQVNSELHAIGGNQAYLDSLRSAGSPLTVKGAAKGSYSRGFVTAVLNRQILFALVHQQVNRRHLRITHSDLTLARSDTVSSSGGSRVFEAFPSSYQHLLVRRSAEVTALQSSLAKVDVGRAALRRYFDSHPAQFREVCVSAVLTTSLATARTAERELRRGTSFAKVAAAFSQDPTSRANGGQLGCALPLQFSNQYGSALGQALASLGPGHLTPPLQVRSGWVVATVTSATPLAFSEATPAIRSTLLSASSAQVSAYIEGLVRRATVKVDPRYGTFVATGKNVGLQPPASPPARALVLPTGGAPGAGSGGVSTGSPSSVGAAG